MTQNWLQIRDAIIESYDAYDGFIILHGTDTMAYTAAALSYLIQNSKKPIVLTGLLSIVMCPSSSSVMMIGSCAGADALCA